MRIFPEMLLVVVIPLGAVSCMSFEERTPGGGSVSFTSFGQDYKLVSSRDSTGQGAVGILASVTNTTGKTYNVVRAEAVGGRERPTLRITTPAGTTFEVYGTIDSSHSIAEVGNFVTNVFLIDTAGRVYGKLIDGTFDLLSQESADAVKEAAIDANAKVRLEEIRNPPVISSPGA